MIKAVVIDDEPAMQEVNRRLLKEYFPEVKLAGIGNSVESGIELIKKEKPHLVLLDVELNESTGFHILQQLKPYSFKVVFITGYDTYALKAIKFSALDYILKPVNEVEFQQAIQHAIDEINQGENQQLQTGVLFETLQNENQGKKLVLKTMDSLHIVDACDIFYCRSDNSYTTFHLANDEKIMVSRSIREYEELLSGHGFFRPHQSFLVNLNHVKRIDKSDGGFIIMKNKKEIPVSLRQKKRLIQLIENL
ncbi:two component transcriptional regulator, LytTR family [Mariniphaga anaerophila]|uniref:Two component transcriptional regulator, LytTR family n=1 Tax=Mariniphaga anaerophila TaxID=1484053 RepID=A0A1M5DEF7_9BACT|nr:LytTR family DNA-binding domain-containing protein [Mariniphaga anaerophila]SHF65389.1 two component transcriptional regulator, LytTR family [Mariniphaga anaerophila]